MILKLRHLIPLILLATALSLLVLGAAQQILRQSAYDPQIQISEDLSNSLNTGLDPLKEVPSQNIDVSKSLAPFTIVYDASGSVIVSTGKLDNQTPNLPKGVLDYTKDHNQDRLTWQPKEGVRIATIVTKYNQGYVLAGKNMRETESRILMLVQKIFIGWILSLAGLFIAVIVFTPTTARKK